MTIVSLILLLSAFINFYYSDPPSKARSNPDQARQAIDRGLAFMQKEITQWNKRQNCVSCHNALPIIWSLRESEKSGFAVDQDRLNDWTQKSLRIKRRLPDESLAYLLLGRNDQLNAEAYEKYSKRLLSQQRDDGSWQAGGQRVLQKRRSRRSDVESTMWSLFALTSIGQPDEGLLESRERAVKWLSENRPFTTTEGIIVHALLGRQSEKAITANEFVDELLSWQNEDGGWGRTRNEKSDAIATGQSLYTLNQFGLDSDHPQIQKAVEYLVQTQNDDGTWSVSSEVSGWNKDLTHQSIYWATAWAVIGLSQIFPVIN